MSFDGHVDCQRIEIGPCAFAIIGKPNVAPPAATPVAAVRNLRREAIAAGFAAAEFWVLLVMRPPRIQRVRCEVGAGCRERRDLVVASVPVGIKRVPMVQNQINPDIIATRTETSLCGAAMQQKQALQGRSDTFALDRAERPRRGSNCAGEALRALNAARGPPGCRRGLPYPSGRRSRSACASVPASTYSSSPPTGTPRASRVTLSPRAASSSPM